MGDPVSSNPLLNYGVLGIFAVIMLTVIWVLFKRLDDALEREVKRADKAEAQLQEQTKYTQETLIPTAISMVNVSKELVGSTRSLIELEAQKRFREQ